MSRPLRPASSTPLPARCRRVFAMAIASVTASVLPVLASTHAPADDPVVSLPASSSAAAATSRPAPPRLGARVNVWGNARYEHEAGRAKAAAAGSASASSGGAQRFRVTDRAKGDAHLVYAFPYERGRLYRASLKLRADKPTRVEVMMRRDVPPYDAFALTTVQAGPKWQRVDLEGRPIARGGGSLRIAPVETGVNVWVDEVKIEPGAEQDFRPVLDQPIAPELFGLHLMRLGMHMNWPEFDPGVVRLWDTRTMWKDLQPEPHRWDFSNTGFRRLDLYVDHIRKHSPATKILYVLGQTPQWASSAPESHSPYGAGHAAPPKNLEDWREYVRTLARRYAGRITYWELWNEPDFRLFYLGSVDTMVEMARIAHEELKAADPRNTIVSPGLTAGQGLRWLDRFLAAGGGRYVDIVAFHWYYGFGPEAIAPFIDNVRGVMRAHHVDDKPLWNTEGALAFPKKDGDGVPVRLTEAQQRGLTPRALLTMWSRGVSGFAYYFWEGRLPGEKMLSNDFRSYTEAGRSYMRAAGWIKDARIVDGYRAEKGVQVFRLERDGRHFQLIWSVEEPVSVRLPEAWHARRIARLDGSTEEISTDQRVLVTGEPVLID
ncbi:glycosyl hydrolase [Schlegelella sp. S2-27]|uniref:Glycosyl hydrolase n=1 Tax=Caldimonas mangrovi TaxID=2944811 RepID=A0ABT0YU20_9BURK|nr:glycosyl hydrolase [Caldimonas mangrovi]MCM5681333.1 glycosyl hydrolase [Caldimonas mangrovi]